MLHFCQLKSPILSLLTLSIFHWSLACSRRLCLKGNFVMSEAGSSTQQEQLLRDKHVQFVKGFESIVRSLKLFSFN